MNRVKGTIKSSLGIAIIIASFFGGIYIGGWVLFFNPIINCLRAFYIGNLTGTIIVLTLLECIFAIPVGKRIIKIGNIIGKMMVLDWF